MKRVAAYWYHAFCLVFTAKNHCGQISEVQAKHKIERKVYENGETLEIECESKPCCFKCNSGEWEKQKCECKTLLLMALTKLCNWKS